MELPATQPTGRWWMDRPVRLIQTNLREADSVVDPMELVRRVDQFGANTYLLNMGGIVAQYPTEIEFHLRSPHLPEGRDLFGDALRECHARGIRVIGRFDLSKTQVKAAYDKHPEWFFKMIDGRHHEYNGLWTACINGGHYHDFGMRVLTEALERYPVDGLFFNWFGNHTIDYARNQVGPCQCDECKRLFQERYRRELPTTIDAPDYSKFIYDCSLDVAAKIVELIHRLRPKAGLFTYRLEHTDGVISESNTAIARPLPMWAYSASDNTARAHGSEPDKVPVNLCMQFLDFQWRFVTVPPNEIRLRLHQNMAHGGALGFAMVGTFDQEDRNALLAAEPVYQWHRTHEEHFVGQKNLAKVLLLTGSDTNAYRGWFRLLSEQHIPFVVSTNLRWMTDSNQKYDVVIAPGSAPKDLEQYVTASGRLLIADASAPPFGAFSIRSTRPHSTVTWRIHDRELFPSLKDTHVVFQDGPFVEMAPLDKPLLTLIPQAMHSPPEKVWVDKVETDVPGLAIINHGQGRIAYLPWNVGEMYYRHSTQGHAGLMVDLVDHLLPDGRQIVTNVHPLVEMTLMHQPHVRRTQLHLINLSGHSQTAYFDPIKMCDVQISLRGSFRSARAMVSDRALELTLAGAMTEFKLPLLHAYELVVLD